MKTLSHDLDENSKEQKFINKVKVDDVKFKPGDYFYLDNLHKDHYETFSKLNESKGVFNTDGSLNANKTNKVANRKGTGMLRNIEEIKIIKDNKNDLIDGTFCYQLFEDKLFDQEKLLELIRSVKYVSHNQLITEEIKSIVHWIVNCVD